MSGRVERLAVLGLGLLGGSVAWAARERRLATEVVGQGRRKAALDAACARGVVDRVETDPAVAVRGADLVLLATPVEAMSAVVRRAAPQLVSGTLVTDVGSVKGVLAETLPGLLPKGVSYVGAHPMAGGHRGGVESARPDLFDGATCVVCPGPASARDVTERVVAFWGALGARVVLREPAAHDAEVAWTSHVPHVLAFAFGRALAGAPRGAGDLAGPGFRDFTRIAHSDPALWGGILDANRKALAAPLGRVTARLAEFARILEAGDARAAERFLAAARAELERLAPGAGMADGEQDTRRSDPERGSGDRRDPPAAGDRGERSSA